MYYQAVYSERSLVGTLCSPLTDLYIFIFSFLIFSTPWQSLHVLLFHFFLLSSLAHREHHAFEGWSGKHWVHCMPRSFAVIWCFELVWTRRRMVEALQKCYMWLALLSFWHFKLVHCYWNWKKKKTQTVALTTKYVIHCFMLSWFF